MKGTFVMIDGVDGCGKGTVTTALRRYEEKKGKRVLGQSKGKIILTDAFFEPLPDDILEAFNNPE